jgi:hypothetical protein
MANNTAFQMTLTITDFDFWTYLEGEDNQICLFGVCLLIT